MLVEPDTKKLIEPLRRRRPLEPFCRREDRHLWDLRLAGTPLVPRDCLPGGDVEKVADDAGAVRGLLCTVWETTDKMLAQRRLAASESRLRALVLASTNASYRMNADWTQMLEINGQGFVADTSVPSASWIDLYIPPADRAGVLAAVRQAIDTRSRFELEHRVVRTDGTLGWTLSRAVPVLDGAG